MNSTRSTLTWTSADARATLGDAATCDQWDRLNAARRSLPFLSSAVVKSALDIFGEGSERLLVGRSGGHVRAMFVLKPVGTGRWQSFQPSQLPLGAWVAEADLELSSLTGSLIRGPLGICLALSITQVDPLLAARGSDDDGVVHGDYIDTAWVDIVGSFDAYWSARGKNLRQNMRKQRNKLQAEGRKTTMRVWASAPDMAPALQRYGALESKGWKSDQGTAIHPDNPQGRFYLQLLERAALQGEARVYEYLFDDETVAMNLCLLRDRQLIVLKTTYDESIRTLSPAFLLREEELQSFFSGSEVARIEYYGKVMDWHTKFTESRRTLYHHTRYRWAWVQRVAEYRRKSAEGAAEKAAVEPPSDERAGQEATH